jgi:hypothetical protein
MKRRARRARNEQPEVTERWRPGLFHLLGIALLLTIVAGLLRSNRGLRLGLPGAFVWVTALFIAFGLRLADLSRFVLPPEAEHQGVKGWQEGLRMLVYYFAVIMLPPSLRPRFHRRREYLPPELPTSFAEFQAGFVDSHLALALGKGTGFARAVGPGYVRLNRGERISHVVDLRRQIRREDVEAFTRDGIRLESSVAVTFRVRDAEGRFDEDVPFPYDPDCIFRLTYSDGVGANSEIPWSERIAPQAASLLVAEIARYRLDQLYRLAAPETPDAVSLSDIVSKVNQGLTEQLLSIFDCSRPAECPVEIQSVSVGQLAPPDGVVEQRIRNWQSVWERRKALDEAESAAFEIREIQRVRARALAELIENVTYNVEEMRNGDRETISKVLMLRMTDMLDRLIGDQRVQMQTPQHVFETLSKASAWLKALPPGQDES